MSDDVTLSGKAKLEDIGISRNQSSDWQKIAVIGYKCHGGACGGYLRAVVIWIE